MESAPSYPRGLDQAALASDRPRDLAALDLRFLGALTNQLTGSDQVWTADARLGRAFRAECLARLRLDGEYRAEDSPGIPFRNSYYICLRGRENAQGFWTNSYRVYADRVLVNRAGSSAFESTSISQAFPSRAECSAYLAGAGVTWPPEIQAER